MQTAAAIESNIMTATFGRNAISDDLKFEAVKIFCERFKLSSNDSTRSSGL